MKPILTATASEIVHCVRKALEDWVRPVLQGKSELSYVTTASHLLSYVEHMIEHEGQMLLDETILLRDILSRAVDWLHGRDGAMDLKSSIAAYLLETRPINVYPSLRIIGEEVALLRQHICDLLSLLHRENSDADLHAQDLHAEIRKYIAWQLVQETRLVEPSFRGRGPRR